VRSLIAPVVLHSTAAAAAAAAAALDDTMRPPRSASETTAGACQTLTVPWPLTVAKPPTDPTMKAMLLR
jgi:hypothetical protein